MLALLGSLYVLSFIDRFILALLVAPLKADLGLSDVQLGLLFGTFFALFYGLLGVPLARLADRGNRKRLIIAGVVVWSACTLGSAFVRDYATLATLRFGLAIGEAALTPAAFSMLTDAFPPRRRMLASTLFSASGMLGASLSFALGAGVIAAAEVMARDIDLAAWRIAFVAVGVPGFVLAALFALVAREPARASHEAAPPLRAVLQYLGARRRLYGGLATGAAAANMMSYAMVAWSPVLLERSYGLNVKEAGVFLGSAHVFSAVGGTLVVPTVIRALALRSPGWAARVPALATIAGAILVVIALQMPTILLFLLFSTLGSFLVTGAINSIIVLIQPIAPSTMRATFTALLLICISSIGLGVGPPVAAMLGGGPGGIGSGLTALGLLDLVLAGAGLALAARPLRAALSALQDGKPT
jgi:MFS family permease